MTPAEFAKDLGDAIGIIEAVALANPELALAPGLDLLKNLLEQIPPIDAPALNPDDRAAADKDAADAEAAKLGTKP